MTENHGQFQAYCTDDIQPKEADTWLLESQAVVDEIVCRAVECEEDRIESGGPELHPKNENKSVMPVTRKSPVFFFRAARKVVVKQVKQGHSRLKQGQRQLQGNLI